MVRNDLALIHVMLFPADDLVVLVALAGKYYNIALLVAVNRILNGGDAVLDLDAGTLKREQDDVAETEAEAGRQGIWATEFTMPWEWRRAH